MAEYSMVGFILSNTLSEFGSVARGVCQTDAEGFLQKATELTKIEKNGSGAIYTDSNGNKHHLTGDEVVSMNLWGFTPSIFGHLHRLFEEFLKSSKEDLKSEFFIPTVVNDLIKAKKARAKVLRSDSQWFGITYQPDRPIVAQSILQLVNEGHYPKNLWM
jgi:hypothetical protein